MALLRREKEMPTDFWVIPNDEVINNRKKWLRRGHTYMIVRAVLMVVESIGRDSKNGPAVSMITLPRGSEFTTDTRVRTSVKLTDEVAKTLEVTVTKKLHAEVMTAVRTGSKLKAAALESTLQTEMQSRVGLELTNSVRDAMTHTRRVEIETTTEVSTSIRLPIENDTRVVRHLVLRPTNWDVYLVKADAVLLKWHRNITGRRVRKIIRSVAGSVERALFRLKIYEPQTETSIFLGNYVPDVDDTSLVQIDALEGDVPHHSPPSLTPLSSLAKRTFPTTAETARSVIVTRKKPAKRPVPESAVEAIDASESATASSSVLSKVRKLIPRRVAK